MDRTIHYAGIDISFDTSFKFSIFYVGKKKVVVRFAFCTLVQYVPII